MIDLNNLEEIKKLDPKNVYGSTGMFASQCEQIWEEAKITLPQEYKDIRNVILCGMGGSAYGGYVVQALYKLESKAAIYSNNEYTLPAFANEKSLILLSSYSGSTEESLSCGQEAYSKSLKVAGITSGGKLAQVLKKHRSPHLLFNPKFNPSQQPRLGTGYMVLGFIGLLNSLGIVTVKDEVVAQAISELKNNEENTKNKAIEIAKKMHRSIPIIFSSEFLNGNAHIMRNQINETAKSFSAFEDIPELNHHLMEGLKNPLDKKLHVLFLNSSHYQNNIKKRMSLTIDVVGKNHIPYSEYKVKGSTPLSQVLHTLSFGGFLSLFLGLLYGQDPSLIPWVDYFKEKLAK